MTDDLVRRLDDLHRQATVKRSHFYVGKCVADAKDRIEALEDEVARLKIALNYFFLRDIEKPANWEYGRNLAEELARAALRDKEEE